MRRSRGKTRRRWRRCGNPWMARRRRRLRLFWCACGSFSVNYSRLVFGALQTSACPILARNMYLGVWTRYSSFFRITFEWLDRMNRLDMWDTWTIFFRRERLKGGTLGSFFQKKRGHSEKDQSCLARKGDFRKRDLWRKCIPIFGKIWTALYRKMLRWFAKELREKLERVPKVIIHVVAPK